MGSYGTCKMDSIHGRLFELKVYVDSLKFHTMCNFVFVLVSLMIWPIAALVAIPVSLVAGNDKTMEMFKLFLVLATLIGIALWTTPVIIVSLGGGVGRFYMLIMEHGQLTFLDFVDMFLSEFMILLTIVFAWVFHEITLDVGKYKEGTHESWRRRHGDGGLGHVINFSSAEVTRFGQILKDSGTDITLHNPKSTSKAGGALYIDELIKVMETLPGWESGMNTCEDHFAAHHMERGLWANLALLNDEAAEKHIWAIDIWLANTQFYHREESDKMSIKTGVILAFMVTKDIFLMEVAFLRKGTFRLVLVTTLALIRAMLPRLWLKTVNGGHMWPPEFLSPASFMVLYSTSVTFVVGFCWISLFYCILMDYRHNLVQMVGVSALVDPAMRYIYSQYYLMSMFWFGLNSDECEEALARLPLLDLRDASNAAAFWRIREYAALDASNERMAISILLEIVIMWLFLKFVTVVSIMSFSKTLPAVLSVMLFDLAVFGALIIIALETALKLNTVMDEHKRIFVDGRYMISGEMNKLGDDEADGEKKKNLYTAKKLLANYLEMCNEYDSRDQILFGMTVTGGKIMSSAFTVGAAIWTLLRGMVAQGKLEAPEEIKEQMVTMMAVPTLMNATRMISSNMHSFLGKAHLG